MSDWTIVVFIAGWVFAPFILIPLALVWRWFFPIKPFVSIFPSHISPPEPPPPLTDEQYRRFMATARLVRRRMIRGLV